MKARRIKKAFGNLQDSRPLTRYELVLVKRILEGRQWSRYITKRQIAADVYLVQQLISAFKTPELEVLRQAAVEAIFAGQAEPRREALNRYLDLAEAAVDKLSDVDHARTFGQIGLIAQQAFIWRDADEPVNYLRNYLDLETYCDNLANALAMTTADLQKYYRQVVGLKTMTHLAGLTLDLFGTTAYLLWARGNYAAAVDAFEQAFREDWRSPRERAVIKLRLVQCLLDGSLDTGGPSPAEHQEWADLLKEALPNLEGEPEQKKVQGLLDEIRSL